MLSGYSFLLGQERVQSSFYIKQLGWQYSVAQARHGVDKEKKLYKVG